jgi:hypothetical protein
MRLIPFQEGMKVGFGYDLVQGSALTSPAVQGAISTIQGAGGQRTQSHLVRITDVQTMHEVLGVNVDAGGSYFGVSADVKVDFAKECNVSTISTHVLTGVTVKDAFENFDDPVLTKPASNLITNNNSDRFHQRFGDLFIDGLLKGGEYFAVFEINSVDQSVRQRIASHVEVAFNDIAAAGDLQVNINNEIQSTSSHAEVRVHVMQNGAIDHTDQTLKDILDKARNFPPSVSGNLAVPFAVSLADYTTLELPNDQFNFLEIQNQRDVLAEHARKRFAFLQLLNTISYIRQHPEDFVDADKNLDKLAAQFAKVTDDINIMEKEASTCLQNAKACAFTPFDVADFPLPKPKRFGPVSDGFVALWANVSPADPAGLAEPRQLLIQPVTGSQKVNVTGFFPDAVNSPDQVTGTGEIDAQGQALSVTLSTNNTAFRFDHDLHCQLVGGGLQVTDIQTRTNLIVNERPFTSTKVLTFSKVS